MLESFELKRQNQQLRQGAFLFLPPGLWACVGNPRCLLAIQSLRRACTNTTRQPASLPV
jgi:hypothetical protein